ncbi:Hypothetical protein POVR2_LOCUS108 [uncultured virus]|nr:Hypothetical protein POVR2_LOCUS108 [uncultured virus]
MQNLDILALVLSKLDNKTLEQLYIHGLREQLTKLLGQNSFWKLRAEYIAASSLALAADVDWKRVYYAIDRSKSSNLAVHQDIDVYEFGFDHLPSLLALIQLYGKPDFGTDEDTMKSIWSMTSSPEVLDYLIKEQLISTVDDRASIVGLEQAAYRGDLAMLDAILSYISEDKKAFAATKALYHAISANSIPAIVELVVKMRHITDQTKKHVLQHVAKKANSAVADFFYSSWTVEDWDGIVDSSLFSNNDESMRVILKYWKPSETQMIDLFNRAFREKRPSILMVLDEVSPKLKGKTMYNSLLTWSIKLDSSQDKLVRYLLTKADPAARDNQALKTAIREHKTDIVQILLADERVRLDKIAELLELANNKPKIVELLLDSDKLDVTKLQKDEVELMASLVALPSRKKRRYQLEDLQGKSLSSLVFKYILIKRPNASKLLDWMISLNNKQLAWLADKTLDNQIVLEGDLVAVQALMLYLLRREARSTIDELREYGVREEDLERASRLVHVYLGSQH